MRGKKGAPKISQKILSFVAVGSLRCCTVHVLEQNVSKAQNPKGPVPHHFPSFTPAF